MAAHTHTLFFMYLQHNSWQSSNAYPPRNSNNRVLQVCVPVSRCRQQRRSSATLFLLTKSQSRNITPPAGDRLTINLTNEGKDRLLQRDLCLSVVTQSSINIYIYTCVFVCVWCICVCISGLHDMKNMCKMIGLKAHS